MTFTHRLTGLGDRSHLLSRQIGLDTHVQDIVSTFEFEDFVECVSSSLEPHLLDRAWARSNSRSAVPELVTVNQ